MTELSCFALIINIIEYDMRSFHNIAALALRVRSITDTARLPHSPAMCYHPTAAQRRSAHERNLMSGNRSGNPCGNGKNIVTVSVMLFARTESIPLRFLPSPSPSILAPGARAVQGRLGAVTRVCRDAQAP